MASWERVGRSGLVSISYHKAARPRQGIPLHAPSGPPVHKNPLPSNARPKALGRAASIPFPPAHLLLSICVGVGVEAAQAGHEVLRMGQPGRYGALGAREVGRWALLGMASSRLEHSSISSSEQPRCHA